MVPIKVKKEGELYSGYIYKVTNIINNKVYIGQTYYINRRIKDHKRNAYHNPHFKNAINYYGIDNFKFEILWQGQNKNRFLLKKILNHLEIFWIARYQSNQKDKRYNANAGGDGNVGLKYSEESRRKMSLSAIGKHVGALDGRAKSIKQYDLNGNLIRVWDCITDVERTIGIKVTAICNNLKGYSKQCGGFIWKYNN